MIKLIVFLCLLFPLAAFPGQGRDGGWPESIQFLRLAKANLLELLAQSSDQDVKDAINGMHDRDEAIKVADVDLALIKKLVNALENPDVEKIEKSDYKGVRLFSYDNSDPMNPRIFATKNFFSMERYQVPMNEMNPSILKEVQILILHEISHLWGFGEENGDINYARTFAVRMVNILHGSMKVSFTPKEKVDLLSKAFFYSTTSLLENNAEKVFAGKRLECLAFTEKGESPLRVESLDLGIAKVGADGFQFMDRENSVLRWTSQNYLIAESTAFTFSDKEILSSYMLKKGAKRRVTEVVVCHADKEKLSTIEEKYIRPYFTKSNLLTDYSNSSRAVFQSLLVEDLRYLGETFKASLDVSKGNQNQIIQNIDFKIKVQHAEVYNRLTGRKYKYSKPQDDADIQVLNSLVNSDVSDQNQALWAQITVKVRKLNNDINFIRNNISRQLQMNDFFKDYLREFNAIADRTKDFFNPGLGCGAKKRVGEFYACQLEENKVDAQARIKMYENMAVDIDALMKKYTNRAYSMKD